MQRSKKTISSLVCSHLVSEPCFLAPIFPENLQGAMITLSWKRKQGVRRQEIERRETEGRAEA